jgi:replicative superfamily II helicase
MKSKVTPSNLQVLRDFYIRALDDADNSTEKARLLAEDLFALDLTVYSRTFCFDSVIYNSFAKSYLDENIFLHPEQIELTNLINENEALIISAPTSFGKTFCIFEYIARFQPQNIVLIVPTLALVDEYLKKIINRFYGFFRTYKIHTNISVISDYDFDRKNNIFILTHDRVVQESLYGMLKRIDFLVIDEVYKLEKDISNDRVLILNLAYYYLSKISKKYVLLAPFIHDIEDKDKLDKNPHFYKTMFSPVVNEVITCDIINEKDRTKEISRILSKINEDDKTLIYFPTVTGIYNYVKNKISSEPVLKIMDVEIVDFLKWAKDEIHEEWYLVKALERGYLVHNGQLQIGTRLFQMDMYENGISYNKMLCTSTLLEGVNTTAKNIIITKPSRNGKNESVEKPFTAFDFYNLVGRTGRLYKHFLGRAYYIKAPNDPIYQKSDAIKSIKFELTDVSKDIDIQTGNIDKHEDFKFFLKALNITYEEYIDQIGSKPRFETVKIIFQKYTQMKSDLINELGNFITIEKYGKNKLINILYLIVEGKPNKLECLVINQLIHKQRLKN